MRPPSSHHKFNSLFSSHRDAIWAYCYRRLDRDEVADAVSDVFVAVWRKIDAAPDGEDALPWMYGVARNVVRNSYRSTARRSRLRDRVRTLAPETAESPEAQVVRTARHDEVLAALDRLKPMERELVRLRTWEELSHAEIATVTGLSVRGVESRLARARRRLERTLDVPSSGWAASPRPIEEGGER